MINNRQAGRRRGRGGQRQQGGSPGRGPESGNRIDNRARGNAAQLLEKYKNLARDAQMQGDRVNLEYYLQFADHYFRVLADSRARQEEANPGRNQQPRERNAGDDFDEDFEGDAEATAEADRRESMNDRVDGQDYRGNSNGNGNNYDRQRPDRQRQDRPQHDRHTGQDRQDRPQRDQRPVEAEQQAAPQPVSEDEPRAPRRGRPPRAQQPVERAEDDRLPATMLPPSIQMGVEGEPASDDEMPVAPRRRGRPRKIVPDAEAAAE